MGPVSSPRFVQSGDDVPSPLGLLERAAQFEQGGRTAEAIESYNMLLELFGEESETLARLGRVLAAEGRVEESLAVFARAFESSPEPCGWMCQAYAGVLSRTGEYKQASEIMEVAVRLEPQAAEHHIHLGALASACGEHTRAVVAFRRALEIEPDNGEVLARLARCQAALGDHEAALVGFSSAFSLIAEPQSWMWQSYAAILEQTGNPAQAIEALEKARALEPQTAYISAYLGELCDRIGDIERARSCFLEASELEPQNPAHGIRLGTLSLRQGNAAEACSFFEAAFRLSTDLPSWAFRSYASALLSVNRPQEAICLLQKLLEAGTEDAEVLTQLDSLAETAGDLETACSALMHYLSLKPQDSLMRARLGVHQVKLGDFRAAVETLSQAVRDESACPQFAHQALAEAYLKLGQRGNAVRALEDASRRWPDCLSFLLQLGALFELEKRYEQAQGVLAQAYSLKPDDSEITARYAALVMKCGKRILSCSLIRKALDDKASSPGVLLSCAEAFAADGELAEALTAMDRALELEPLNEHHLLKRAEYLFWKGDYLAAVADYQQAILLNPALPAAVYRTLAGILKVLGRMDSSASWVTLVPKKEIPPHPGLEAIWHALNTPDLEGLPDGKQALVSLQDMDSVELYFAAHSDYTVINLGRLSAEEEHFLARLGMKVEMLRQNAKPLYGEEVYYNASASDTAQDSRLKTEVETRRKAERRSAYQLQALEKGCMEALCPFSGEMLSTTTAFIFDSRVCYRFSGAEVFYLLTLTEGAEKYGLYFPRFELVVQFDGPVPNVSDADKLNRLKARVVCSWRSVRNHLCDKRPRELVGVIGGLGHLGHHLWNDLSALDRLAQTGLLHVPQRFFVLSLEYYGAIEEILPKIADRKIERLSSFEAFDRALEENCFPVALGHSFVRRQLVERILSLAEAKCNPAIIRRVRHARHSFPLLWVTIRVHNRTWASQSRGIAEILKALIEEYPRLGIIFDGVSRVDAEHSIRDDFMERTLVRERAVVQEILAMLPLGIFVRNLIGASMSESLLWAQEADLFLSHHGASLIKINMIAGKPGVVHTNRQVFHFSDDAMHFSWRFRENGVPFVMADESTVRDLEGQAIGDLSSVAWNNYECDWLDLLAKLKGIIALLPQRGFANQ